MIIDRADIRDIVIFEPKIIEDDRGYFFECYRQDDFTSKLPSVHFKQENQSKSAKGTFRGLHYQLKKPQGKLVKVAKGRVLDIVVDVRKNSPTFGKSFSMEINDKKHTMMYIPPGFAHGFYVLSEYAIFQYKCTAYYDPLDEYGINWNDEDLDLDLPKSKMIISERDQKLPKLKNVDKKLLPA